MLRRLTKREPEHQFLFALADLHAFHMCGLTPPGFEASDGSRIVLNEFQEYLWECAQDMVKRLPPIIDGLFLVGDLGEGQNPAERARQLSEVDPTFQARGVVELLRPFTSRTKRVNGQKNIYMVHGSRYHTGRGARIEEFAGEIIQAKKRGPYYAPPWREIMVADDIMVDVGHHQSFTIRYRSMPLEREYAFKLEQYAKKRKLLPPIVIILRAHTHGGLKVWREQGGVVIGLPPMKIQDFFAQSSRTPNRLIPDNLGAVGIKIYNEPVDGHRVHVMEDYLYQHPDFELEVMPSG